MHVILAGYPKQKVSCRISRFSVVTVILSNLMLEQREKHLMDLTTGIAFIALIVSFGSLGVTVWATKLSKRSLEHAIDVQERTEEKELDRLRTDLLMQIADSRRLLDKTRIEIGTLKASFEGEQQPVQAIMRNYTQLFTEYLPKVEAAIAQLDVQWKDVSGWSKERGHRELLDSKALLYRCLKDDEVVYDSGMYMVNVFKGKLEMAKQYVTGATR